MIKKAFAIIFVIILILFLTIFLLWFIPDGVKKISIDSNLTLKVTHKHSFKCTSSKLYISKKYKDKYIGQTSVNEASDYFKYEIVDYLKKDDVYFINFENYILVVIDENNNFYKHFNLGMIDSNYEYLIQYEDELYAFFNSILDKDSENTSSFYMYSAARESIIKYIETYKKIHNIKNISNFSESQQNLLYLVGLARRTV